MTLALLDPLLAPLRRGRADSRGRPSAPDPRSDTCPHCGSESGFWPVGQVGGEELALCTHCGGLADGAAQPLALCPSCAAPANSPQGHADCFGGGGAAPDDDELERQALTRLAALYPASEQPELTRYLGGVLRALGEVPGPLLFLDLGEPAIAALPGGGMAIGLGLLATLEDEAQLAFALARERALSHAGWVERRFRAAASRRASWWRGVVGRRHEGIDQALELSIRLGFGRAAEQAADREAFAVLVRAEYDPAAAYRALRLLESASLAGQGGRFLLAADRAHWLESGALDLGASPWARSNREVYRRAIGGFAVFGR